MKIVFAGTPQFAVPFLEALTTLPQSQLAHEILAVYTKPDQPAGRGLKLTASPVKEKALAYNIPVFQPKNFRDLAAQQQFHQLNPDILIDVAYGVILPEIILNIPKLGCINVHPSLLPRWRGASPIQHAILAGDLHTGVTIMQMDTGLDTGAILQQEKITIADNDTTASLSEKIIPLGIKLLLRTLQEIQQNSSSATPQNESASTYAHKLTKEQAKINWNLSAIEIDRNIRAFTPWPIAYTEINKQIVRIWQAHTESIEDQGTQFNSATAKPGTIIAVDRTGLLVATGSGVIRILKVQLPGKKALAINDILNAHATLFTTGNIFT